MRTEDGYIIHQCLNGEKEAFGFLVDKYKTSVYAFAYSKVHNFHDAEDLTQEAFIKAFRNLRTLRRWDSFLAWLYSITFNLCKNFLRAKANRPDREFIAEQDSGFWDYRSISSYQEKQALESIHEVLEALPETYRDVLTLSYLGGMKSEEIARFLGTSPSNVRQRLSRARSKLKQEMLDMMSKTYDRQRLQPSFTFRIVEMVKDIRIQPAPRAPWLPWGFSAAAGIVLTVLMFSPHLISLTPLGALLGSPLPSETKVMQIGELPVDVLDISEITFLSSERGDDDGGVKNLNQQNALAPPLAPQAEAGTWTKRADMPTAREGLSTIAVNGKIYAIGGWPGPLQTVEEYDPVTNKWTQKADMPTAMGELSTSVVNGKIYAIGGWKGWQAGGALRAVEEYDPIANIWTKKADMPTARGLLSASVVKGKIYVIGGYDGQRGLSTVEEYDPATDTWTKKADMPTARVFFSTSVVNNKIYAIGGGHAQNDTPYDVTEEYDPATDTWTKKADMPTARAGLTTGVVNGKIYAIGGAVSYNNFNLAFSEVEIYDPVLDKWEKGLAMPTARAWLSSSVANGKIYVIGGRTPGGCLSLVEEYTREGWPSSISPHNRLPTTWGRMKAEK